MTSQPGPAPTDASQDSLPTKPLRELAALILIGVDALLLLVGLIDLLIPSEGTTFALRASDTYTDFVGVLAIVLPVLAVLLATHIQPRVARAKVITLAALAEYAASALFAVITLLTWLVWSLGNADFGDTFTGLLSHIAYLPLFGIAAFAVFTVWRKLYYVPSPKPSPGVYGQPQGQPGFPQQYGQPGGYGQPAGYGQQSAPAGYGQPGGYGQQAAPAGYGQQAGAAPTEYGQPGGYGQPTAGGQPSGTAPGAYGQPVIGQPAYQPAPGQPSADATQFVPTYGNPVPTSAPPTSAPPAMPPVQPSGPGSAQAFPWASAAPPSEQTQKINPASQQPAAGSPPPAPHDSDGPMDPHQR